MLTQYQLYWLRQGGTDSMFFIANILTLPGEYSGLGQHLLHYRVCKEPTATSSPSLPLLHFKRKSPQILPLNRYIFQIQI